MERIAHKHASLQIVPEQYATVGKYLLAAITTVLGADVFKGELYDAWAAAYWNLAYVFIKREAEIYDEAGWVGWKEFVVSERVQESESITSFYFKPKDGSPLPKFKPGQYLCIRRHVPELGRFQARQYAILPLYHIEVCLNLYQVLAVRRSGFRPLPHLRQAGARHPRDRAALQQGRHD